MVINMGLLRERLETLLSLVDIDKDIYTTIAAEMANKPLHAVTEEERKAIKRAAYALIYGKMQ